MSSTSRSVSLSAAGARPRRGRIRPWLALRGLARQIWDSEDTAAGARFVYALQGQTTERMVETLVRLLRAFLHRWLVPMVEARLSAAGDPR